MLSHHSASQLEPPTAAVFLSTSSRKSISRLCSVSPKPPGAPNFSSLACAAAPQPLCYRLMRMRRAAVWARRGGRT